MDEFTYRQKHILITGAGGGLGMALTRNLFGKAARIVLSDRSLERLSIASSAFAGSDAILSIPADLSVPGDAQKLAAEVIGAIGHIDVIINNAGIGYHALMEEAVEDKMRSIFEVNAFSPIALVKALLPAMRYRGSGIVINILSCAGFIPAPTTGVYGASKAAFSTMARTLRLKLEPLGIKVFNFYPGPIATSFNENAKRENRRSGVYACGTRGREPSWIADKILLAAKGRPGDIWLDRRSKWLSLTGTIWPKWSDQRLASLRDASLSQHDAQPSSRRRRWKLWQIESSIACNLDCIMCPWKNEREQTIKTGDMSQEIWAALRPHLSETSSVDFTGGGEPLLHPHVPEWIKEANQAGCRTGFLTNGLIMTREKVGTLIEAGMDWIGFSVDGATADVYEKIRKGANFKKLCGNIATMNALRRGKKPWIMINFVMMRSNIHQTTDIVRLASDLGVDQVNFKQCDVIRGEHGRYYGLFASRQTREIRSFQKALRKANRLAKKLNIQTTQFSFVPEELPVCIQDPRHSLFIRQDGIVAPCINLAYGGATSFLGKEVTMPNIHYGRLPDHSLMDLWETTSCRFYKARFEQRTKAYDSVIASSSFEPSLIKLNETLDAARKAMPTAPDGCGVCHYLYDI